jgi:hypothetical protein
MTRFGIALFAALLLLSVFSASTITGQITNADKVRLSGTIIEVVKNGAVVATATADDIGNYRLDLDDGAYFFRFVRSGYQLKVLLFEVKGTSSGNNFVLSMKYPTATVYGRVYGAAMPGGFRVSLYKSGTFVRSVSVLASGEYYMPDVYPGEYTLSVTPGDYDYVSQSFSVAAGDVLMEDVALQPRDYERNESTPDETILYSLEVPGKVNVGAEIVANLVSNTGSACNKTVIVTAPNAAPFNYTTGCDGKVRIVAVEPGAYYFEFEGVKKECVASVIVQNETGGLQGAPPQQQTQRQAGVLGFSIFEIALFGGIVVAVGITSLLALYLVTRKEKPHRHGETAPAETSQAPAKPKKARKARKK